MELNTVHKKKKKKKTQYSLIGWEDHWYTLRSGPPRIPNNFP